MAQSNKNTLQMQEKLKKDINRLFLQLTVGCGNSACKNQYCASNPNVSKMDPNGATALSLQLARHIDTSKYFCITDQPPTKSTSNLHRDFYQLIGCCTPFFCDEQMKLNDGVMVPSFSLGKTTTASEFAFSCWLFPIPSVSKAKNSQFLQLIAYQGDVKGAVTDNTKFLLAIQNIPSNRHIVFKTCSMPARNFSEVSLPLNTWTHVAIVGNSRSSTLFVNGLLDKKIEHANKANNASNSIYIAKDAISDKQGLDPLCGLLDDVRYYGRPLQQEEIVQLHQSTKPVYPKNSDTPWYPPKIAPIRSLKELQHWRPHEDPMNISHVPLAPRPPHVGPKVLVCHDMKGGYLGDVHPQLTPNSEEDLQSIYDFHYWEMIDIFVYFSHERVTIPPASWTNVSHRSGVKMLGTFITEWESGELDNILLLDGIGKEVNPMFFVNKLVALCEYYNFDGWLINIESKLPSSAYCLRMAQFLDLLTKEMHKRVPGSLVIWYDSIIASRGTVTWQSELNSENQIFFEACDGIFLDYHWNPTKLQRSAFNAKNRSFDVFTGIDIFGRNTYGGGGFDTWKAMDEIKTYNTSVALFAPGWTLETNKNGTRFFYELRDEKFWLGREYKQLLKNGSAESELMGWKILANGGDGWKCIDKENVKGFVTSYGWCTRCQTINLLNFFDERTLDACPDIQIGESFIGHGPNPADLFYLKVELREQNGTVIAQFNSGECTATAEWKELLYTFNRYGNRKPRTIYWEDGGKDVEGWAGHYGVVMTGAFVVIRDHISRSSKGIAQYSKLRQLPDLSRIPFVTNFGIGMGKKFFIDGQIKFVKNWWQMSQQTAQPTPLVYFDSVNTDGFTSRPSLEISYNGGSSWMIRGQLPKGEPVSIPLYKCHFEVQEPLNVEIVYHADKTSELHMALFGNQELSLKTLDEVVVVDKPLTWRRKSYLLAPTGDAIQQIHVVCKTNTPSSDKFCAFLGQLIIAPATRKPPPTMVKDLQYKLHWNIQTAMGTETHSLILKWKLDASNLYYDIYEENTWRGRSYGDHFCLENFTFGEKESTQFKIQPVDKYFQRQPLNEAATIQIHRT